MLAKKGEKKMSVGNAIKELRGNMSQLELSFLINVSRETISSYETGRAKLPKDVSLKLMERFDDPFFALTVAHQYTGTGVRKLDGNNIDLHRCSVKEKTIEELEEMLDLIKSTSLSTLPKATTPEQRQKLENLLLQTIDTLYALTHLLAITSNEYEFSWRELWEKHLTKLISKDYIKR